jgi:hypothetical protein
MFPSLLLATASALLTLDNGNLHLKAPTTVRVHRSPVNWEADAYNFYEASDKESFLQIIIGGGAYDLHSFTTICQNGRRAWKLEDDDSGSVVMGQPGVNAVAARWSKLSGERLAEAQNIVASMRIDWGKKC